MTIKVVQRDSSGQTLLHQAATVGNLTKVQKLLQFGADVSATDNNSWTPLHNAAINGHHEVVEYLLMYGADIDAVAFEGETPLHDASANGHKKCVIVLLNYGSEPFRKNMDGKMAKELVPPGPEFQSLRDIFDLPFEHWQPNKTAEYYPRKISQEFQKVNKTEAIVPSSTDGRKKQVNSNEKFARGGLDDDREGPFESTREEKKFKALWQSIAKSSDTDIVIKPVVVATPQPGSITGNIARNPRGRPKGSGRGGSVPPEMDNQKPSESKPKIDVELNPIQVSDSPADTDAGKERLTKSNPEQDMFTSPLVLDDSKVDFVENSRNIPEKVAEKEKIKSDSTTLSNKKKDAVTAMLHDQPNDNDHKNSSPTFPKKSDSFRASKKKKRFTISGYQTAKALDHGDSYTDLLNSVGDESAIPDSPVVKIIQETELQQDNGNDTAIVDLPVSMDRITTEKIEVPPLVAKVDEAVQRETLMIREISNNPSGISPSKDFSTDSITPSLIDDQTTTILPKVKNVMNANLEQDHNRTITAESDQSFKSVAQESMVSNQSDGSHNVPKNSTTFYIRHSYRPKKQITIPKKRDFNDGFENHIELNLQEFSNVLPPKKRRANLGMQTGHSETQTESWAQTGFCLPLDRYSLKEQRVGESSQIVIDLQLAYCFGMHSGRQFLSNYTSLKYRPANYSEKASLQETSTMRTLINTARTNNEIVKCRKIGDYEYLDLESLDIQFVYWNPDLERLVDSKLKKIAFQNKVELIADHPFPSSVSVHAEAHDILPTNDYIHKLKRKVQ